MNECSVERGRARAEVLMNPTVDAVKGTSLGLRIYMGIYIHMYKWMDGWILQ